jgi:putative ABC transport system ATP-binding protein
VYKRPLLREAVSSYGQTTLMVTHDPRAAAMADRILFLADGLIVRDQGQSTSQEVLAAMSEVSAQ